MASNNEIDKRVLAPYYLSADTADLIAARKSIEFELYQRMKREKMSQRIKEQDAERAADMRAQIDAIQDVHDYNNNSGRAV